MQRVRLYDIRLSRLPKAVGLCADDLPRIAQIANAAQNKLIFAVESGSEGWIGTWAEIAFRVSQDEPYITTPREVARLDSIATCSNPVTIRNQFYEYLRFGNGRMPRCGLNNCIPLTAYSRNNVPTFVDISDPPQLISAVLGSEEDEGKRVFIQGLDSSNNTIYSQDTFQRVQGVFLALAAPFVATAFPLNRITGIQKDITQAPVQIFQVDPDTAEETLLLTMEPGETTAWYRRYLLTPLPTNCCGSTETGVAQVTAIAKLEPIPMVVDTDYSLITGEAGLEALIEESLSVHYSTMDTMAAKQFAQIHHKNAIRLLNAQITHYLGHQPSVEYPVFGSARLANRGIGTLV